MLEKILIIGGSGLVGSTVSKYFRDEYQIYSTFNHNEIKIEGIESIKIDLIEEKHKILDVINKIKPNFIIHAAAHRDLDLCEKNHHLADLLHLDATKKIMHACNEIGSKLVFLSTDAVFDGKIEKKYTEKDETNPINYYGITKLEGEKIVLGSINNLVLRTSVIFGWHNRSRFTNWILDSLREGKSIETHKDQFNTPTLADDLAAVIIKALKLDISGLFHATGKTCLNRYDFAVFLTEKFGLDKNLIYAVSSLEKKQVAPRPLYTCLNSEKFEKTINFNFKDIHSAIDFIFAESQK